jgi:SAM-dependent methyltransferase
MCPEHVSVKGPGAYSGELQGLRNSAGEAWELYRLHSRGVAERVGAELEYLREVEKLTTSGYAFPIRDQRVLDVGAGQRLIQLAYFSRANDAVGIDLEVIAQGFDPRAYARMLRLNGLRRTVKTLVRKALLIDARYRSEVRRQLGLQRFPRLKVLQMDASRMDFPDASFDFVFSYSVFQTLPDPGQAFREVERVLRPGGVAYVSFQLYSSANGCLDPRFFPSLNPQAVRWPHLRSPHSSDVRQNAVLNRLRLDEWHTVIASVLPGADVIVRRLEHDGLAADLAALRDQGELADYSDEELLANEIVALWRKQE